jgi:hypothetical protein
MKTLTVAIGLSLGVLARGVAFAQPYPEPTITYTVRRGDTCRRVAQQVWRAPDRVDLVHRYNRLGATLPHVLTPGATLVLPRSAGTREPDARVTRAEGSVTRIRTRPPSEQAARPQMDLARGDRVSTRSRSTAQVTFRDQTFLRLQENSTVLIYGPTQARAQTLEVAPSRVLLQNGTLEAGLLSLARSRDLTVTTPNRETVILRASEAGMSFTPPVRAQPRSNVRATRGSTTVSVYRGTAQARAGTRTLTVREGTALTIVPGQAPTPAHILVSAPAWTAGASDVLLFAGTQAPELRWEAVDRAVRWRVDIASDERFVDHVQDVSLESGERAWRPATLPPGRYQVRVRGVDNENFIGMPSASRVIQVVGVSTPRAEVTPDGTVRLQRGPNGEPDAFALTGAEGVALNGTPYTAPVAMGAGHVTLTLPAREGGASPAPLELNVEVVEPRAEVSAPTEPVATDATLARLSVALQSPDGTPYDGPPPTARVSTDWRAEVRASEVGRYDVMVLLPAGPRPATVDVSLTASWGASLGSATVRFAQPVVVTPPPPPPPPPPRRPAPPPDRRRGLGFRFWGWYTPPWMVGLFATEAGKGDWRGALSFTPGSELTFTTGPEYTFRRGNLDVVLGLQYTGLGAEPGYFHGTDEDDIDTERIESQLWLIYANVLFLWHTRVTDWFELQYGTGVGLGYVGGDLYRTQVHPAGGGLYDECTGLGMPDTMYCSNNNAHFRNADGTRFSEGRLSDTVSGSIPPVVPWVSLPHVALYFRPHRRFDFRLDGGFALIGFYAGLAAHVAWD